MHIKKITLTTGFLFCCSVVFAQKDTVVKVKRYTMTGADYARMVPKITDSRFYDPEGHVIDSVKARQMIKSFDYDVWQMPLSGQKDYKHVLVKINHAQQDKRDAGDIKFFWPKSEKFAEGATLDLRPIAKHTKVDKLDGKAVLLLFYNGAVGYKDMYEHVNDAVDNNIANHKFEVLAITTLDYENAKNLQRAVPILNAHQVVDAPDLIDFYETEGLATMVLLNAKHQVIYATKNSPVMMPRTLNRLLKEL